MQRLKNIALTLIVCFYTAIGISQTVHQKIDSLKLILIKESNIDTIINIKYNIAALQMNNQLINEATTTLQNLLHYSTINKREIGAAKSSLLLGRIFVAYKHQNDSASYYIDNAIKLLKKTNTNTELIQAYMIKTRIYESQSDFENQLKSNLLALEIAKNSKDNYQIAICSNALASYFLTQEKYEEALKYAKYGLKYGLLSKNNDRIIKSHLMLAQTYNAMSDTVNASIYFEKTYHFAKEINNKYILAALLPDWANISENRKALEMRLEAEEILNTSETGANQTHNKGLLGILYFNMFKNEMNPVQKREFFDKAELYLTQSIKNINDQEDIAYSISLNTALAELYFTKKDFEKAYIYLGKSTKLNDSLNSQEIKNRLAKVESQKEIDLRDKEIEVNQLKLQTQRKQQLFLIGGLTLLAIIGGLLFYQNRTRKKTNNILLNLNKELDESNKVKARFFGILNHDLRSPVSNLIHFLHLKSESPELFSEENRARLELKTISAAENLLVSMEDILLWSKGQMENFKPQFKNVTIDELFMDISKHFSSEDKVKIRYENPESLNFQTDENYLKTIMRNLTGNAIKAMVDTKDPLIVWNAKEENGKSQLSITDNGPGGSVEKFRALYDDTEVVGIKTGLGLHLIRDLAKAIHCEIEIIIEENKGTTIILNFD